VICLIAGNSFEAYTFAKGQFLADNEWFYPETIEILYARSNFHVLVVGTAGQNVPNNYFERLLSIAQIRGKIGRP